MSDSALAGVRDLARLLGLRPRRLVAPVALGATSVLASAGLVALSSYLICRASQRPPILSLTMLDLFRVLVMPRAARGRYRLSRLVFTALWRPWRWIALRARTESGRERFLAGASPFSLFALLVVWAGLTVLAYALVLWSPPFVDGVQGSEATTFGN